MSPLEVEDEFGPNVAASSVLLASSEAATEQLREANVPCIVGSGPSNQILGIVDCMLDR